MSKLFESAANSVLPKKGYKLIAILTWLLLFVLPVWPSYIQRKIGALPAINGQRVVLFVLISICFILLAFGKGYVDRVYSRIVQNDTLFKVIGLYFFVRVLSCAISPVFFYSLSQVVWELVDVVGCLFVVMVTVESGDDVNRIVPRVVLLSSFIVSGLAIYEGVFQINPLAGYSDVSSEIINVGILDKLREGVRRAQGTFASPLLLSEYCSIALPFIWIVAASDRNFFLRFFSYVVIVMLLMAIYFSHSRIGAVSAIVVVCLWFVWKWVSYVKNKNVTVFRYMVAFYGFVLMMGLALLAIVVVIKIAQGWDFDSMISGVRAAPLASLEHSTNARFEQLVMAVPKIISSPLLGYGVGLGGYELGYAGTNGMLTVDNYFLLVALDSGLLSVVLWVCFYILVFKSSLVGFLAPKSISDKRFYGAAMYMVISVVLSAMIHSLSNLFPLVYFFVGCLMVINSDSKSMVGSK